MPNNQNPIHRLVCRCLSVFRFKFWFSVQWYFFFSAQNASLYITLNLNLDNQYIINPFRLHAILNFSFFFRYISQKNSFRFVWFRSVSFRFYFYFVSHFTGTRGKKMHWRFGLKIRKQFTVSIFSLTIWQTLLHILINVYWNKSGLIQTDATNDIVVYSFLAWLITSL